ncbi:hypothetical protein HYN48_11300 [Flavobacterium magnum]|uniref:Uncharacterized protein n=1 Tax=Flavobacterium magnum TaxID=2162713 RepID=A0A2S0RG41_9FLAO|nr:hypothetical protein [Flavobacterium magnum]AWA30626.1 hypothetical protein HYN48_11300 [Flavobacterium magnum]
MSYTREQVEAALKSKKYVWFEGPKDYDVNIVGIRNTAPGKSVTNVFDDFLTVSYKVAGAWQFKVWPITTDPGTKAVRQFTNPNGVARLIPNQYRGSHSIGLHQNKYEALKQQKNVKVWRDKNKDMSFDETTIQEGVFGINIHRSNPTTESQYVENWSEGCQVFKRVKDFNEFMSICNKARAIHGNSFTYTLIESKDIP